MQYSLLENIEIVGISSAIPRDLAEAPLADENKRSANSGHELYRSKKEQTASDLGFVAAEALLNKSNITSDSIGVLLFVSTTPDYRSPGTAFVLQKRLNIPTSCIAFDLNQGNTGFAHSLMMASSMLLSSNANHGLIILGDTRSKQGLEANSLFTGDAGGAVLIQRSEKAPPIHLSLFTESKHMNSAFIPTGGFRTSLPKEDSSFVHKVASNLGPFIYDNKMFRRQAVRLFHENLSHFANKANMREDDDMFIILQTIDDRMRASVLEGHSELKLEKLLFLPSMYGNSGSANPLLYLTENSPLFNSDRNTKFLCWMFGEGLSGAFISFELSAAVILETIHTDEYYDDGQVSHNMDA